jgi:hypothetical protein
MYKVRDFNVPIPEWDDDNCIILICVIKNEYIMLDYFLKYYSSHGVTHFIFIDNESSDGSLLYLRDINYNILLFRTGESYKENDYGTKWVRDMLYTYCKNKWCAVLDADEIIYNDLSYLRDEMKKEEANVCKFYLLDMYSKNPDKKYVKGQPFLEHSDYYDRESNINNSLYDGVRKRTMDAVAYLGKVSFFKFNFFCCSYVSGGYHYIKPYEEHSCSNCIHYYSKTNILLHFKFIKPNLKEIFYQRVKNGQDWDTNNTYEKYLSCQNYNFYHPIYSKHIYDNYPYFSFI